MSSDQDMTRILRSWLANVEPLPDSVIGRALAQVPGVAQRRARWRLRRPTAVRLATMPAVLALGIILAAVTLLRLEVGTLVGGPPAGFVPTGSMQMAREVVATTTLLDGSVLAVGGWDFQDQAIAELWDPATGSFRLAGSLPEPREGLSATLLPDGRVLVVGGDKYKSEGLATAALWDPVTLSFTATGSLAAARRGHAAVPLPDGRVLIVGGDAPGAAVRTAELWDPTTGSFGPAGTSAVFTQLATQLRPDGRVLVVGNASWALDDATPAVSAELWDPVSLSFSPVGSVDRPMGWDTTTVLPDGRVLLTGGCCQFGPPDGSAVLWDPATSEVVPAGTLLETRWNATATLLPDGRVLVAGGDGGVPDSEVALASAEVWDPATVSFKAAGSLSQAAETAPSTVLPDGSVLVIGGTGTAEIWHP